MEFNFPQITWKTISTNVWNINYPILWNSIFTFIWNSSFHKFYEIQLSTYFMEFCFAQTFGIQLSTNICNSIFHKFNEVQLSTNSMKFNFPLISRNQFCNYMEINFPQILWNSIFHKFYWYQLSTFMILNFPLFCGK